MSIEDPQIVEVLKGIHTLLTTLNSKMDTLIDLIENTTPMRGQTVYDYDTEDKLPPIKTKEDKLKDIIALTSFELASLPEYLQVTALALNELQTATTQEVADRTQKERGIESSYLNQLYKRGNINKFRVGRRIFFSVQPKQQILKILRLDRDAQELAVVLLRSINPLTTDAILDRLIEDFEMSKNKANKTLWKALPILESMKLLDKIEDEESGKPLYTLLETEIGGTEE